MNRHILIQKTHDVTLSPEILKALGMDTLFSMRGYDLLDYLTCDTSTLSRRSLIFRDVLKIPGLHELLRESVSRLTDVSEILRLQGKVSEGDRGLYALRQLELYFAVVDALAAFFTEHRNAITSGELSALFEDVAAIAESEEYICLRRNTAPALASVQHVKSITVGFNIDAALTPYEAGLLSINDTYVESGSMIDRILRLDALRSGSDETALHSMVPLLPTRRSCTADEYEALTHATYIALGKVFKKQVRRIEPEIHQYIKSHLYFLMDLLPDLRFICDLSDIQKRILSAGLPLCVPDFRSPDEHRYTAEGLYNPILALHKQETGDRSGTVKNDVTFDEQGGIFLLTGPNSGGKTVFLKSVGIAQIMAQVGMMVPATRMTVSPVRHLYVEFPRYTTDRKAGGRLEYECAEIRAIFSDIDDCSLVLLDEAFSSTSPDEAVALALEVLKAMSLLGVRGIYISHYHLLTQYLSDLNSRGEGRLRFDFLVAEIAPGEARTYHIARRAPDGQSYAGTIAERYGISAERLAGSHRPPSPHTN